MTATRIDQWLVEMKDAAARDDVVTVVKFAKRIQQRIEQEQRWAVMTTNEPCSQREPNGKSNGVFTVDE